MFNFNTDLADERHEIFKKANKIEQNVQNVILVFGENLVRKNVTKKDVIRKK